MIRHWTTDPTWCRPGDGAWVSGGTPRRLWRLGAGGRRVADALERGEAPPAGHEPLTRRLVEAGALHPRPDQASHDVSVTVIIPTHQPHGQHMADLVTAIGRDLPTVTTIVAVDDASPTPVVAPSGAQVIRSDVNLGPGGARNLGVRHTTGDLVVFLDDDVLPEPDWWNTLVGHFDDPSVVAAAPRVLGPAPHRNAPWWARSEQIRSPLDLGWVPAPVQPGGRVPYVPAAALVVRRDAFDAVGGFDPALRFGEDVDLLWRLVSAGGQVRYEPASVVRHRVRRTWTAWMRQRFHYGTSAATLAARHPGNLMALRLPRRQALFVALALRLRPSSAGAAAAVAAWSVRDLARALTARQLPDPWRWAMRWGAGAHAAGVVHTAQAVWRPWWPAAVAAARTGRSARRWLGAALLITVANDLRWWRRTPVMDPVRFVLARRLDDVAYGAGVWWGAAHHRVWEPLRPQWTAPDKVTQP